MDPRAAARNKAEELYRTGQFLCSEAVFLVANEFSDGRFPTRWSGLHRAFPWE